MQERVIEDLTRHQLEYNEKMDKMYKKTDETMSNINSTTADKMGKTHKNISSISGYALKDLEDKPADAPVEEKKEENK